MLLYGCMAVQLLNFKVAVAVFFFPGFCFKPNLQFLLVIHGKISSMYFCWVLNLICHSSMSTVEQLEIPLNPTDAYHHCSAQ